ncbi:uncharacterized protein LOC127872752 [Dreissena polymorpha]|uniref:Uncharacterized protein n=1 Tax=Dreissena polymorpha TaxID=45954 RepID=A0A9D4KRN5_DREPO|nr:uncharacterized protein LOC127872752 [Dreissena polymorpha]XP_052272090.1 uncharacterized protein LOC127872752 [Dreissena polymorpha]XP_052272091.1 uncharacterized protein LOC127872752 [Dreissena polymorpha]KAH3844279.1 hypothetical protein DPMN_086536 [Dreissena polymorpha]
MSVCYLGTKILSAMFRKCGSRGFLKFMALTVFGMSLYALTLKWFPSERTDLTNKLGPLYQMIIGHRYTHLEDLEGFEEVSDQQKIYLMKKVQDEVHNLMSKCQLQKNEVRECESKFQNQNDKILTIFTTWMYDKDKFPINNKTLFNWRTLPDVNLIVFSDSEDVNRLSKAAGWSVVPIQNKAAGAPILPEMFIEAKKTFKSYFYAYANGDLLFTDSLITTLRTVLCSHEYFKSEKSSGLLIVGRRTNIPAASVINDDAISWSKLHSLAKSQGELFQTDAEDYFISDSKYPWESFQPVAVGRRGYDNWVVAFSRYSNKTVIDASETVLCLHQTLDSRGNYEGLTKGNYNLDLIAKLNVPFSVGGWGRTFCSEWKTWSDLCGHIVITKRKKFPSECLGYKLTYQVWNALFGKESTPVLRIN